MKHTKQWRGLSALVTDAVVGSASAVERVHLAVSSRPFDILEEIPIVSAPSSVVRVVHDLSTRATYASIRGITRLVGRAVDLAIDLHAAPPDNRDGDAPLADASDASQASAGDRQLRCSPDDRLDE